jgi:hypothetical protein
LDERSGWRNKLGVDELRWAILNASGLESDGQGEKRKVKTGDVKVAKAVEKEVELPWNVTEQDPFYQGREPEKIKKNAKVEEKSYWKPETLP